MVKTWLATTNGGEWLYDSHTLAEAVEGILQLWMEDGGTEPQMFWVTEGEGCCLATLMRDQCDPEVAHVTYADGTHESYRCRYVLGEDGMYDHTEVTKLEGATHDAA